MGMDKIIIFIAVLLISMLMRITITKGNSKREEKRMKWDENSGGCVDDNDEDDDGGGRV